MERKFVLKVFVYFLCVSFLLTVNGFHGMVAAANQDAIPIGQMISRGGVKFEIKENTWEKVETPFPIFEGMKIKTEKGEAVIALAQKTRVEIGADSLFYFDQGNRFNLVQGKINFRIEPGAPLKFKVGDLWITNSYPLQAAKASFALLPGDKSSLGSIMIHSTGSVSVKSIQGPLHVGNQDGKALTSLSSGDSITIPAAKAGTTYPRIAQRDAPGVEKASEAETKGFLGLSDSDWLAIGITAAQVVGVIILLASEHDDRERAVCP